MVKLMKQALKRVPFLVIDNGEIDEGVRILQACVAEEAKDMGLN
jgi:hypothetical protein